MNKNKPQILNINRKNLKPYERNARTHSESQVAEIAASIEAFGFNNPVLIDGENGIIAGHGRVMAAEKLGLETVPCVVLDHLDSDQRRAYILADNKLAEKAGWDHEILASELKDLEDEGFDLSLTGFETDEINELIDSLDEDESDGSEDQIPEDAPAKVQLGEIWKLGNHRIMCGDSTSKEQVEKLMAGEKADMVFTDPPYNVASDSKNFAANDKSENSWFGKSMKKLKNSEWDKNFEIEKFLSLISDFSKNDLTCYIWTSHFLFGRTLENVKDWCDFSNYLIWSKPNPIPSLSKRHPTWNTELCVYATRGSKRVVNFPKTDTFFLAEMS